MRVADAEPITRKGLGGQNCYRLNRVDRRSAKHEAMRVPPKMGVIDQA
jgi:hypothetical protein